MTTHHHNIKLKSFDKLYIISQAISEHSQIAKWVTDVIDPTEEIKFDFIGPVSLGNYRSVGLTLGQSFKTPTRVLLIEKGRTNSAEFVKALREYSATDQLDIVHLIETDTDEFMFVGGNVPVTFDCSDIDEEYLEYPKMSSTVEIPTADFDLTKKIKHTWREMQEKLISGEILSARRLDWENTDFVAFGKGSAVTTEDIWIKANKAAAERNGGQLIVKPYYTYCDGKFIRMNWSPNVFDYEASDWVDASLNMFLTELRVDRDGLTANYELLPGEFKNGANKLVPVYDLLDTAKPVEMMCVSANIDASFLLLALLTDMKKKRFHKDTFATSVINAGDERPYNSDVLHFDMLDISIAMSEDLIEKAAESTLFEIEVIHKERPDMKLVIDLDSFTKDVEVADLDPAEVNERAVKYVNCLIRGLKAQEVFKGLSWAVVDMEAETAEFD